MPSGYPRGVPRRYLFFWCPRYTPNRYLQNNLSLEGVVKVVFQRTVPSSASQTLSLALQYMYPYSALFNHSTDLLDFNIGTHTNMIHMPRITYSLASGFISHLLIVPPHSGDLCVLSLPLLLNISSAYRAPTFRLRTQVLPGFTRL